MTMGGSGGGGGPYYNVQPEELKDRVREAADEIAKVFAPELQGFLDEKLRGYNERNADLIERRQKVILRNLGELLESELSLRMGGSVAKHTYVDGLSDIDYLLIIRDGTTKQDPVDVLSAVASRLERTMPQEEISVGRMAVTVRYRDAMELQLVPAVRDGTKLRVPAWTRSGWSRIDPSAFTDALTRRNQQCGQKLIPTIKLAKAIIATWPEQVRLSGYHVESLAIDAFRAYRGEQTTSAMLPHFFEKAATSVLTPLKDRTGQSLHVDGYLGKAKSTERLKASHWCSQVGKRMKNASTQRSLAQWTELFE
jgi:hypothetical protein